MDYGLEMLTRPAWIEVDLAALRENFANIKGLLPEGLPIVAVVKADAYGHGAVQVAECLLAEGASRLAVATLDEALTLRRAGITAPIMLLGFCAPELPVCSWLWLRSLFCRFILWLRLSC